MKFKINLRIIVPLLAIISSTMALAQNAVSGKVSDNSGKGIQGASVTTGSGRGTQTNTDGYYSLSLPNGSVTITVSFVGFVSVSKTVTVTGSMTVDFDLQEATGELGEVIMNTGSRS
ncbi:MAG TPA: carboxypeptidase-like regulatory domain-containing protein, partial [Chitinophagaceae bacterium]|nr:carboxypeptidase-like regulatory domain-containing protein [Chitinophagaceae bacterium]